MELNFLTKLSAESAPNCSRKFFSLQANVQNFFSRFEKYCIQSPRSLENIWGDEYNMRQLFHSKIWKDERKVANVDKEALALHKTHRGKLEVRSKVPLKTNKDLTLAYTPGVAAPIQIAATW